MKNNKGFIEGLPSEIKSKLRFPLLYHIIEPLDEEAVKEAKNNLLIGVKSRHYRVKVLRCIPFYKRVSKCH